MAGAPTWRRWRRPAALATPGGGLALALQAINAVAFATGIALAPVSVVLFAVATVPVWSAIFGALFLGDRVGRATAATSAVVIFGLSVFGEHGGGAGDPVIGAVAGLAVAIALSGSFTLYRARADLPILLTVGMGAGLSGLLGAFLADALLVEPARLAAIGVTGALILPASFWLLSEASRHTQAANVSLFLLLETVFGPLLVWAALGEAVGPTGLMGGIVVVGALAVYLRRERRIRRSSA